MAAANLVWSKAADSQNLTLIVVNAANGTFTNSLAGKTALSATTQYRVRVLYMDSGGQASNFSVATPFVTAPNAWARTYGGAGSDIASAIQQAADGGYIVAGSTSSFGAGADDAWVLKLNSDGSVAWQKVYGGTNGDSAAAIQQTTDGGYIVAGRTDSFGAGFFDAWLVKLNGDGSVAWQMTYGEAISDETAQAVQQTTDGGYIVAGTTSSIGPAVADVWLLKLNGDGSIAWQKTYGGVSSDSASAVQQTTDGGYIVAGYTRSFGVGGSDGWVLKLNGDGSVAWQKTYGGASSDEIARAVGQTTDGGYIVAGQTGSFGSGFWILKLNGDGSLEWQKTYGGSDAIASAVQQTADGGYIVAGLTGLLGSGGYDVWGLKLNGDGSVAWQKTYGGTGWDLGYAAQKTADGGYVIVGNANFGAGGNGAWVLKLNPDGTVPPLGANTAVTPQDTSVAPVDSTAAVANTAVVGSTSSCTVTTTNCTVTQQAP